MRPQLILVVGKEWNCRRYLKKIGKKSDSYYLLLTTPLEPFEHDNYRIIYAPGYEKMENYKEVKESIAKMDKLNKQGMEH